MAGEVERNPILAQLWVELTFASDGSSRFKLLGFRQFWKLWG